jgi:hypothetical protein
MNVTFIIRKPVKRLFTRRQQWAFELRSGGRLIDPRESYFNRDEAGATLVDLVTGDGPVVLVTQDRWGREESREVLR